jgi:hypothetical protein
MDFTTHSVHLLQNILQVITPLNNDNFAFPATSYWEMTFRAVSSLGNFPGVWEPGGGFILRNRNDDGHVNYEVDLPEVEQNYGSGCDLGMGSWTVGSNFGSCPADPNNYHTYGTVVKSSASTKNISGTIYFDGGSPGSTSNVADNPSYQLGQKSLLIFWNEPKCNQGGTGGDGDATCISPSPHFTVDVFLKSIRIFSCASWQAPGNGNCVGP